MFFSPYKINETKKIYCLEIKDVDDCFEKIFKQAKQMATQVEL